MRRIALLTEQRYDAESASEGDWYLDNILQDDRLLIDALALQQFKAERINWARTDVDWSRFEAAVFRTTWDYFERFSEFTQWVNRVSHVTKLINSADIIQWNMNKHYLADLDRCGVSIVPTKFLERETEIRIAEILQQNEWTEAVIKPCVSGAARHTYRVDAASASKIDEIINPLLKSEAFLIQPFQRDVLTHGETSLIVVGNRVTHAIRKRPKPGDFRVQDDHGGTVHSHQANSEEISFAEAAIKACPGDAVYGRVDLVRDNSGRLCVMELELVEPELWLRCEPKAATMFAEVIASQIVGSV